jgi:hypothetical protein
MTTDKAGDRVQSNYLKAPLGVLLPRAFQACLVTDSVPWTLHVANTFPPRKSIIDAQHTGNRQVVWGIFARKVVYNIIWREQGA